MNENIFQSLAKHEPPINHPLIVVNDEDLSKIYHAVMNEHKKLMVLNSKNHQIVNATHFMVMPSSLLGVN